MSDIIAASNTKYDNKGVLRINILDWIAETMIIQGRKIDLLDRRYMHPIYGNDYPRLVLYTGRQVGKSLLLAVKNIEKIVLQAPFRTLYVSPRQSQTRDWANDRFKMILDGSPDLRNTVVPTNTKDHMWRVFDKDFLNGSSWKGRYSYNSPDSVRGASTSMLCVDELQDIITDHLPVLEECLSYKTHADERKYQIYSGTPKTSTVALQYYWELSTQNEWMVKCGTAFGTGCGKYNRLSYANIHEKKRAIVCTMCNSPLDVSRGQWVSFNKEAKWVGFRIPQIMTPWTKIHDPTGNSIDILTKMKDYPIARFMNEVLAEPYDTGSKPITAGELFRCCDESMSMVQNPSRETAKLQIFAGIDWGSGVGDHPSYTVISLGAYFHPSVFTIFHIKKFTGLEADLQRQPGWIKDYINRYAVLLTAADWGFGALQNRILINELGVHKYMEVQYTDQKGPLRYDKDSRRNYVGRSQLMDQFFHDIKEKKVRFFNRSEFKQYGQDILNITTEYYESNKGSSRIRYDHPMDRPDDCAHSIIYCHLAAQQFFHRVKKF